MLLLKLKDPWNLDFKCDFSNLKEKKKKGNSVYDFLGFGIWAFTALGKSPYNIMDFVWAFTSFAKSPYTLKFGIRRFEKYQHNDKWLFLYNQSMDKTEV